MMRSLRIFLLVGIAAAFIVGPLLKLNWLDGDSASSASKSSAPQRAATRIVDVSTEPYVFTWPERKGEYPAPALAMRVAPTEVYAWWWRGGPARKIQDTGAGPETLSVEVMVPNLDAFPIESMTPLCGEGDAPFARCKAGRARVNAVREASNFEVQEILLGMRKLEKQEAAPYDKRRILLLREFWTFEDKASSRLQFKGWACTSAESQSGHDLFGALPPGDSSSLSQLHCFVPPPPAHWWQRFRSKPEGYDKHAVYLNCPPAIVKVRDDGSQEKLLPQDCTAYFLLHGRMASVTFEYLPPREQGMRSHLVISAWELLNRQHADALKAPSATAELAHIPTQLAACRALGQEAIRWRETPYRLGASAQKNWNSLSILCRQAGDIATRLGAAAPAEVEPVLNDLVDIWWKVQGSTSEHDALYEAHLTALKAMGKGESAEMVSALLRYLTRQPAYTRENPQGPQREALLLRAWALVQKLGEGVGEEDRAGLRTLLLQHYAAADERQKAVALLQESIRDTESAHGAQSPLLIGLLQQLAHTLWRMQNYAELKQALDRLHPLWLAQPNGKASGEDAFAAKRREEEIGFELVFLYRNYAFNQLQHAAVAPRVKEVVMRMERELGTVNRFVQAARFHQQEVITKKAAPAGSAGGGLLRAY